MTREQEATIERLALAAGRVVVRSGWADATVRATAPDGVESIINEDGVIIKEDLNFSVNWSKA